MFLSNFPIQFKRFSVFLICCLSMSYGIAQDTIMQQSFDFPAIFPPVGWTNTKVAGAGAPGIWQRVTTGGSPIQEPVSDPAEAKFNSYFYPVGTAADLSSDVVDLSVSGTYTVNFWMYRDPGAGADKMDVYVNTAQSSAGGTLIGTIYRNKTMAPVVATEGWYNYSFTIPSIYNTATNYITFKGISDFGFNIYIDNIAVIKNPISSPSCATGIFPANSAVDVCSNVTLSWDIAPYATGYKISIGNNAPNYNNVANNVDLGNALTYSALLANSTFYKWKLRPYNELGFATGCVQNSFTTASSVCYCKPKFIEPNCVSLDFIDDFSTSGAVVDISNMNTNCAGDVDNYSYYSGLTIVANQGSTFNFSVKSGDDYEQGYGIWVDWNIDGDFDDADEFVFQSVAPTTAIVNGLIVVPETAVIGTTRLRVRAFYNELPLASQACAVWNEGESEDYNIQITTCTFTTYYQDSDLDGYGNSAVTTTSCTGAPTGYVANSSDCNDANNMINPGAVELCNTIDDNCNGENDEGAAIAIITPAGATSVCKGTNLILNANTGIGYTYQWVRNGGNITGATGASYNVSKTGNYQVKVTVPGGCQATSTTVACTINGNPNATINTPEGTNLCGLPDLDLVANAGAGFTYIWIKNGVIMPGITTQINTVNTIGDYRVKVTNAAGCSKTSVIKTVFTSCKTGEPTGELLVYPNPTADIINVSFNAPNASSGSLIITDMLGRNMHQENIEFENNTYSSTIDIANFATGVYYITLVTGNTQIVKEIIVAR